MNFDDQRELRTAKFRSQKKLLLKKKMSSLFVDLLDNASEAHTFYSLLYEHELNHSQHHRRTDMNDEMNNCVMIFIEFVCAHLLPSSRLFYRLLCRRACEYDVREVKSWKLWSRPGQIRSLWKWDISTLSLTRSHCLRGMGEYLRMWTNMKRRGDSLVRMRNSTTRYTMMGSERKKKGKTQKFFVRVRYLI